MLPDYEITVDNEGKTLTMDIIEKSMDSRFPLDKKMRVYLSIGNAKELVSNLEKVIKRALPKRHFPLTIKF